MAENDPAAAGTDSPQRRFDIARLYLKDASFEAPNTPAVFAGQWKPEVNVNLQTASKALEDGSYEVVLTVTVEAKQEEDVAFLVEVQQAGVFALQGFDAEETGRLLGAYSLNVLFPYAREAVSDLVSKGSFPQIYLRPIDFDGLYQQQLQKMAQAREESAGVEHH